MPDGSPDAALVLGILDGEDEGLHPKDFQYRWQAGRWEVYLSHLGVCQVLHRLFALGDEEADSLGFDVLTSLGFTDNQYTGTA
jgi:hypothetical protein